MKVFVTGIGTGIGKTVISAIVTEALRADYWKPVQAGDLDGTDTATVKGLISNTVSTFHKEAWKLKHPMSPHAAAALEGVNVTIDSIMDVYRGIQSEMLVVEGAGGLMVPFNEQELVIDLAGRMNIPVILVSRNYLGSINHTLLSAEALRSRNIPVAGIVFNGVPNPATEEFILKHTGLKCLLRVQEEPAWNSAKVREYASQFKLVIE